MYVKVRVTAGAKREKIINSRDNLFEIHTKEPASRNLANGRARELLAETFGINMGKVKLISGHHKTLKTFDVSLKA